MKKKYRNMEVEEAERCFLPSMTKEKSRKKTETTTRGGGAALRSSNLTELNFGFGLALEFGILVLQIEVLAVIEAHEDHGSGQTT